MVELVGRGGVSYRRTHHLGNELHRTELRAQRDNHVLLGAADVAQTERIALQNRAHACRQSPADVALLDELAAFVDVEKTRLGVGDIVDAVFAVVAVAAGLSLVALIAFVTLVALVAFVALGSVDADGLVVGLGIVLVPVSVVADGPDYRVLTLLAVGEGV